VCARPRRRRLEDEAQDRTQRFAHLPYSPARAVRACGVCGVCGGVRC
jgi:hypothetical protein